MAPYPVFRDVPKRWLTNALCHIPSEFYAAVAGDAIGILQYSLLRRMLE